MQEVFRSVVQELVGEEAIDVVSMLREKDEATDEEISQKLEIRLNIIRKTLYKLYDNHLADFRRIRDKSTGWFVYFWKLKPERMLDLVKSKKLLVLKKLKERLEYEKNNIFYQCSENHPRYTFEEAIEITFQCQVCQQPLENISNTEYIKILNEKIEFLENDLEK
ncbi:MAG: transcription factor E [Candidatus Helarchaeota archaeon]